MVDSISILLLALLVIVLVTLFRPPIKKKNRCELGVKRATMIYTDEKGCKMLHAPKWGLQGKPDYIFETWVLRKYIPLEVKSGLCKEDEPHTGDMMQLVAYFLLVEATYGKRPPYGKLVYKNKTFTIRNTKRLRNELIHTLQEMRDMLGDKRKPACKPSFVKCKNCICQQTVCEWSK